MSVSISIQVVSVNQNNEKISEYTTSIGCDQLALMLYDWKGNSFVIFKGVLSEEEETLIKATYGAESMSVQDELEKFLPVIRNPGELIQVFSKIRQQIILKSIKDEIAKNSTSDYDLRNHLRDLMAISECIAALTIAAAQGNNVYITINDY